jgi:hypothetical protein
VPLRHAKKERVINSGEKMREIPFFCDWVAVILWVDFYMSTE